MPFTQEKTCQHVLTGVVFSSVPYFEYKRSLNNNELKSCHQDHGQPQSFLFLQIKSFSATGCIDSGRVVRPYAYQYHWGFLKSSSSFINKSNHYTNYKWHVMINATRLPPSTAPKTEWPPFHPPASHEFNSNFTRGDLTFLEVFAPVLSFAKTTTTVTHSSDPPASHKCCITNLLEIVVVKCLVGNSFLEMQFLCNIAILPRRHDDGGDVTITFTARVVTLTTIYRSSLSRGLSAC